MNTIDIKPYHFLRHWLFGSLGVWPLAGVACLIAWTPVAILSSIFAQFEILAMLANVISLLGLFIIPGLSIGYVLGDMQISLMREHLFWDIPNWLHITTRGGLIGCLLVVALAFTIGTALPERVQWMMSLPIFILPVSINQWLEIRQKARSAWMWILANVVGAIVFSGLFFSAQPIPFVTAEPLSVLFTWLLAAGSLGIITGIVMLWLYERPISDWDSEDAELARVYIEVRNREDR